MAVSAGVGYGRRHHHKIPPASLLQREGSFPSLEKRGRGDFLIYEDLSSRLMMEWIIILMRRGHYV